MNRGYSFHTDTNLCINSWGDEIAGLTGRPASTVLGAKYYDVLPRLFSEDSDAVSVTLTENRSLTLKGYTVHCLCDQMRADVTITPLRASNGQVEGTEVAIFTTADCTPMEKLKHSQRFIDIGKMASSLAHGVRNPLNAIKGAVIYLREKYADEPTLAEFTSIIEEEISRLDSFISRFLSTSVSDAELSETDINTLMKKIEIATSLQAQACNVRPVYNYRDLPNVTVNPFQLEHAILNVINNAMEAMSSGGELEVSTTTRSLPEGEFAVIEVTDTGPGMAGKRVDEMFMQPGKKGKGKGFGLFLTREILQYYGGRLEINSEMGAGTTVSLFIPVSQHGGA